MANVRRQNFARKRFEQDYLGSTILCEHCDDDKEVKWKCNDCGGEYCDKCKRIHLIADQGCQNHQVVRYGCHKRDSVSSFDNGSPGGGSVESCGSESPRSGRVESHNNGSPRRGSVEAHFHVSLKASSNVRRITLSHSGDSQHTVSKSISSTASSPHQDDHKDSNIRHYISHKVPFVEDAIGSFECMFGMADNKTVHHIQVQDGMNDCAWIKCGIVSDDIVLSSREGHEMDMVKLPAPIEDFAVTWNGDILFTTYTKSTIWKYKKNDNIQQFASVQCKPGAICITQRRDVLVASKNPAEQPIEKFTENGLKVPFDLTNIPGNLQTIYNITSNINGDVLVAEKGGWGSGRLVALNANGQFKFRFQGPNGKLDPSSVVCDKSGFIYVCGINCNNVFVVNMEGRFLSTLIPESYQLRNPESIAVNDKGVIWIGEGDGVVKLFQLKYQ